VRCTQTTEKHKRMRYQGRVMKLHHVNKNPIPFIIVMNASAVLLSLAGALGMIFSASYFASTGRVDVLMQLFFIAGIIFLCTAFLMLAITATAVWGPTEYRKALKELETKYSKKS
jgi:hypothetical protein